MTANRGSPNGRRLLRALLIAPLTAPLVYAIALLGMAVTRGAFTRAPLPSAGSATELVLAVAIVGLPVSYGAALLLGAPAFLVLQRMRAANRWTVPAVGAAIGAAVAPLLAPQLRGELFSIPLPWWAGGILGLLTAAVFWRIFDGPHSDRDVAAPT